MLWFGLVGLRRLPKCNNKSCDVHSIFTFNQPNVFIIFQTNAKIWKKNKKISSKQTRNKNNFLSPPPRTVFHKFMESFRFFQWIFANVFGKNFLRWLWLKLKLWQSWILASLWTIFKCHATLSARFFRDFQHGFWGRFEKKFSTQKCSEYVFWCKWMESVVTSHMSKHRIKTP